MIPFHTKKIIVLKSIPAKLTPLKHTHNPFLILLHTNKMHKKSSHINNMHTKNTHKNHYANIMIINIFCSH